MGEQQQVYEVLTGDVTRRGGHGAPICDRLVSLGFVRAGWIRATVREPGDPRIGRVIEVLRSPDADTFAEAEDELGVRRLRFRTILEDGAVIETRLRSRTAIEDLGHWDTDLSDEERQGAQIIRGDPEWLFYADHPRGGLYSETLKASTPALWGRHCERVAELVARRRTAVPPHTHLALHWILTERALRIREAHVALAHGSFWPALGALALLGAGAISWALGLTPQGVLSLLLWIAGLYVAHDIALLAWPRRIGVRIASALPWPRVVPLRKLRARTNQPGSV